MKKILSKVARTLSYPLKEVVAGLLMFASTAESIILFKAYSNFVFGSFEGWYFSLVLVTASVTFLVGMISGLPLIVTIGSSFNTLLFSTLVGSDGLGFSYENILVFVFVSNIIYLILSFFNMDKFISKAIPQNILQALPIGIGLFLVFKGLKLVFGNNNLELFNFLVVKDYSVLLDIGITITCFILLIILKKKNVPFSLTMAVVFGTITYGVTKYFVFGINYLDFNGIYNVKDGFNLFKDNFLFSIFKNGFNFTNVVDTYGVTKVIILGFAICLLLLISNITITSGMSMTLSGENNVGNKLHIVVALSNVISPILGCAQVSISEYSVIGKSEGKNGRLVTVISVVFLILSLFFYPIFRLIPDCVLAVVLMYVGYILVKEILNIHFENIRGMITCFVCIVFTAFTGNIAYGIGFSLLTYIVGEIVKGNIKQLSVATWILFVSMVVTCVLVF